MRSYLVDCKRIEEIVSTIYQQLATDKTYHSQVREVFQNLSDDEKAHMRHIDLVLQANDKDIDANEMIAGDKLRNALALVEHLFQKVQKENLNEEDALRLAVEMEQQFLKVHVDNAIYFRDKKLSELFKELGSEDEAHLNTLKECLRWWHAEQKKMS